MLYVPEAQGSFSLGPTHCTYAVRVPASGVPYVPRTVAPQVASGMEINFSTWDSIKVQEQRTPAQRAFDEVAQLKLEIARREKALLSGDDTSDETAAPPGEPAEGEVDGEVAPYDAHADPKPKPKPKPNPNPNQVALHDAGGKPSEVVNSRLMGTGLELVHEAVSRSAQARDCYGCS